MDEKFFLSPSSSSSSSSSPVSTRAGRIVRDLVWSGFCVFLLLVVVGLALDVHPVLKRADRIIDKQIEAATGSYESSTCAYFRGDMTPLELERWGGPAKAEGDGKCIEADIILSQNSYAMKARYVVYQYIPWESGNLLHISRDIVLYLMASTPFLGILIRSFFSSSHGGGGQMGGYNLV